jgi:hypothetical protein
LLNCTSSAMLHIHPRDSPNRLTQTITPHPYGLQHALSTYPPPHVGTYRSTTDATPRSSFGCTGPEALPAAGHTTTPATPHLMSDTQTHSTVRAHGPLTAHTLTTHRRTFPHTYTSTPSSTPQTRANTNTHKYTHRHTPAPKQVHTTPTSVCKHLQPLTFDA